jgi:plasmid stability protein
MPTLTLDLPDDVHQALLRAAARTGETPEQWLISRLRAALTAAEERAAQMAKLWRQGGGLDVQT